MFESTKPISKAQTGRFAPQTGGRVDGPDAFENDLLVGSADLAPGGAARGGEALRLIDWGELTARLNAARDLRRVLQRDAVLNIEANGSSFADVAASYFRTKDSFDHEKDRGKPDVNPVALEHRKGSPGMIHKHDGLDDKQAQFQGHAVNGDARDI